MSTELYGTVLFAIGAGTATFFAPCSYAMLPGYVGYYVAATDGTSPPLSGVLARGSAAAGGALGTFLLLAAGAVVAGDLVERILPAIELSVGVILIGLGIAVLRGKTAPFHVSLPERRTTVLGFGLFGALYALAATACVLPLFLALVVQSLTLSPTGTAAVLGAYGGIIAVLMLAITVATAVGRSLGIERIAAHSGRLVSLAGWLLVAAGIGQLAVALSIP